MYDRSTYMHQRQERPPADTITSHLNKVLYFYCWTLRLWKAERPTVKIEEFDEMGCDIIRCFIQCVSWMSCCQALELASLATQVVQYKDWWWKVQLGKCYYRSVSQMLTFCFFCRIHFKHWLRKAPCSSLGRLRCYDFVKLHCITLHYKWSL